jgi:hypothetical protein
MADLHTVEEVTDDDLTDTQCLVVDMDVVDTE